MGSLSSELLASYDFMRDKGYCDLKEVGPGDQSASVTYLHEMGVPFMRINHAGSGSANVNAVGSPVRLSGLAAPRKQLTFVSEYNIVTHKETPPRVRLNASIDPGGLLCFCVPIIWSLPFMQ